MKLSRRTILAALAAADFADSDEAAPLRDNRARGFLGRPLGVDSGLSGR
jgi:hypothetical protein